MTGTEVVWYLRTAATMAYPQGRLAAVRSGVTYVLASDGWIRLGTRPPPSGVSMTRQEADRWCERYGWDRDLLDAVPG